MEDSKNGTGLEAGYDEVTPSSEDAAKVPHGSVSLMETSEFKNKEPAGNSRVLQIVEARPGIEEESFKNRTGDHGIRMRDLREKDQFYSSGKGAAGHDDQYMMRILDSQPASRPKTKKIKCLKPKVYAASSPKALNSGSFKTGAASGGGGEHQCFCCLKKFPTLKSLCGHMRLHPKRNWKGIRPSDPSSTAFSAAHEDQTGLLPKWSRTGRRGQNSLVLIDLRFQPDNTSTTFSLDPTTIPASTHIPTPVLRTQDLSDKHKHLIGIEKLENQTQFLFSERTVASRKQMMEYLQPESKSYFWLMIDGKGCWRHASTASDESNSSSSTRVPSEKATECKYEYEQLPVDLEQPNLNVHEKNEKMVMAMNMEMMRMNRKPKVLRPFEPQIQKKILKKSYHEYTCRTCSKTFQTFQALGGHRSSHHKDHNSTKAVETSIEIQPKKDIANPMVQVKETKELGEHDASLHICNICYKGYPTGQALGGHKKRHWAAARSAELARASSELAKAEDSGSTAALTFVQSPLRDGATTQAAGRKVLHFDLNEPYVEED